MSKFLRVAARTAQLVGGAILCKDYLAEIAICSGESMIPTLAKEGDIVIVEKLSVHMGKIEKGDVVVCVSPENPDKLICKRVIDVQYDLVHSVASGLFNPFIEIPSGHVWLEGDNPSRSRDSRDFGPVPSGLIRGKVFYRIWPWRSIGSIAQHKQF